MVVFNDRLTLNFGTDDPRFDEIEIVVCSVDIDTYAEVVELGAVAYSKGNEQLDQLIGYIAKSLVSWNLTDRDTGEPIPLDAAGLRSRPKHLFTRIVDAWIDAQRSLPAPFAEPSTDGAPLAELPMKSLAS